MFDEDFLQCDDRTVNLLFGVSSHQSIAHECVLRSTCGRNDGIDEHTGLECQRSDKECLINIAHIKRNDRTLGITNLKIFFAETLQGIVGDIPECLNALGLLLDDVQGGHSGSGGCRRIGCPAG